jgi:HEXXH motif-containing protein
MEPLVIPTPGLPPERGSVAALRQARASRLARELSEQDRSPGARQVFRSLERLARSAPETFTELLGDPSIGALAQTGDHERALAVVALSLACEGALEGSVVLAPRPIWSLSRRLLLEPAPDAASVVLRGGAAQVRHRSGATLTLRLDPPELGDYPLARLSSPFHTIRPPMALGSFDPNPLNLVEAHPEKQGNALSLGDHPVEAWLDALGAALDILARMLPELYAEMRLLMRVVHPVGSHVEKQLSASYREYIGALYLTLHPQVSSTVEALIHEFQHNKLNLCAERYDLLENAYEPLYPSPIRPDPRPLMGVLLAAHAFVPVAELYRRLHEAEPNDANLASRLTQVVAANDEALGTLRQHGRFTSVGERVFEELSHWHARHLALGLPLPRGTTHVA